MVVTAVVVVDEVVVAVVEVDEGTVVDVDKAVVLVVPRPPASVVSGALVSGAVVAGASVVLLASVVAGASVASGASVGSGASVVVIWAGSDPAVVGVKSADAPLSVIGADVDDAAVVTEAAVVEPPASASPRFPDPQAAINRQTATATPTLVVDIMNLSYTRAASYALYVVDGSLRTKVVRG